MSRPTDHEDELAKAERSKREPKATMAFLASLKGMVPLKAVYAKIQERRNALVIARKDVQEHIYQTQERARALGVPDWDPKARVWYRKAWMEYGSFTKAIILLDHARIKAKAIVKAEIEARAKAEVKAKADAEVTVRLPTRVAELLARTAELEAQVKQLERLLREEARNHTRTAANFAQYVRETRAAAKEAGMKNVLEVAGAEADKA